MCDVCKIVPPDQTCGNCHRDANMNVDELCDSCFAIKLKKLEKYGLVTRRTV